MKYQIDGKEITREAAAKYAARFGYEFERLEESMNRFINEFAENDWCDWFELRFIKERG